MCYFTGTRISFEVTLVSNHTHRVRRQLFKVHIETVTFLAASLLKAINSFGILCTSRIVTHFLYLKGNTARQCFSPAHHMFVLLLSFFVCFCKNSPHW